MWDSGGGADATRRPGGIRYSSPPSSPSSPIQPHPTPSQVVHNGGILTRTSYHTPDSCRNSCPGAGGADLCWDRLFGSTTVLCEDLLAEGCSCGGCCIATATAAVAWGLVGAAGPSDVRLDFEVPSPLPSEVLPSPLPTALSASLLAGEGVNVTCSSEGGLLAGLDEGRVEELTLRHSQAYYVEVRAFDKAGNMVTGCGASGEEARGRWSSELVGQRVITIDTEPPVAGTRTGIRPRARARP